MATPNPKPMLTGQRGTLKLYELAAKKLKLGELSISVSDIQESLKESSVLKFYPLSVKAKGESVGIAKAFFPCDIEIPNL